MYPANDKKKLNQAFTNDNITNGVDILFRVTLTPDMGHIIPKCTERIVVIFMFNINSNFSAYNMLKSGVVRGSAAWDENKKCRSCL